MYKSLTQKLIEILRKNMKLDKYIVNLKGKKLKNTSKN